MSSLTPEEMFYLATGLVDVNSWTDDDDVHHYSRTAQRCTGNNNNNNKKRRIFFLPSGSVWQTVKAQATLSLSLFDKKREKGTPKQAVNCITEPKNASIYILVLRVGAGAASSIRSKREKRGRLAVAHGYLSSSSSTSFPPHTRTHSNQPEARWL